MREIGRKRDWAEIRFCFKTSKTKAGINSEQQWDDSDSVPQELHFGNISLI